MPAYHTFDYLPDLSAADMSKAQAVVFAPYTATSALIKWDKNAIFPTSALNPTGVYSVQMNTGSKYHIFADSFFDPSLTMYDSLGNVVNYSNNGKYGSASIPNWVPDYSGTYYVKANLAQGAYFTSASVSFYEDERSNNPPIVGTGSGGEDYFLDDSAAVNKVDGKAGIDTMRILFNSRDMYTLVKDGSDITIIPDSKYGETDVITSIERLQFEGKTINLEYIDVIQALYVGYFGRPADTGGFSSFQQQLTSLNASTNFSDLSARYATDAATRKLIDSFGSSDESKTLYTGDTSSFVKAVYNNILDRAPDPEGLSFWVGAIESGALTRANASLSIMSGALSNASPQGKIDATLIGKKISVASNFTFALDGEGKGASYAGAAAASSARALLADVDASTDVLAFQQTVNSLVTSIPTMRSPADAPHDMHGTSAPFVGVSDSSHVEMHY